MQNFPDIKDDQRFILEAELFFFRQRFEWKGAEDGAGQKLCLSQGILAGVFLGTEVLCCHIKEKNGKKSHF